MTTMYLIQRGNRYAVICDDCDIAHTTVLQCVDIEDVTQTASVFTYDGDIYLVVYDYATRDGVAVYHVIDEGMNLIHNRKIHRSNITVISINAHNVHVAENDVYVWDIDQNWYCHFNMLNNPSIVHVDTLDSYFSLVVKNVCISKQMYLFRYIKDKCQKYALVKTNSIIYINVIIDVDEYHCTLHTIVDDNIGLFYTYNLTHGRRTTRRLADGEKLSVTKLTANAIRMIDSVATIPGHNYLHRYTFFDDKYWVVYVWDSRTDLVYQPFTQKEDSDNNGILNIIAG